MTTDATIDIYTWLASKDERRRWAREDILDELSKDGNTLNGLADEVGGALRFDMKRGNYTKLDVAMVLRDLLAEGVIRGVDCASPNGVFGGVLTGFFALA
jgi:hypothetical protein